MDNKKLEDNNLTWLKKRKMDKIAKVIGAIILCAVLLKLNDLVFLLVFFYIAFAIGIVTMAIELIAILKNK